VRWAAETADAADFIAQLALGYQTRVGDSGLRLSGGQAQRVAIARALYHQPPVLIFDEATSALDSEAERAVKENLDRLLEGRTAFVIAHRLSTIRDADQILVLDRGRIVERGSHEELLELGGRYAGLARGAFDEQVRGPLAEQFPAPLAGTP
jgi:ABC-type multidrug transport system fused ATPase/permease subunit